MNLSEILGIEPGVRYSKEDFIRRLKKTDTESLDTCEAVIWINSELIYGEIFCEDGSGLYLLNNIQEGCWIEDVEGLHEDDVCYRDYRYSWLINKYSEFDFIKIH